MEGVLSGDPSPPDLAPLIDRLASRLGPRGLFRVTAVESDVPERSLKRVPPLEETTDWLPDWPRPVRLLSRPEPIDNVVALLPDGPPRRFTWRGKPYVVRQADGPERIYGEWWRRRSESEAVRDYFQVEDEDGARFWIFRRGDGVDGRTGDLSWYMHGVFG
jgi:protein ImuB